MKNEIEVKAYTEDKRILLHAGGISAVMHLLELLWQTQTDMYKGKVTPDIKNNTITIKQDMPLCAFKTLTYVFTNVPMQWNGDIDTLALRNNI